MADSVAKLEEAIQQAAGQYYRLVILAGAPGSGKTTVLQTVGQKNGWHLVNMNLELSKRKLVADSKGEWEHIEFKKTTGELHGGMETLCGFLNGSGSKVLFGVNTAGKVQGQDVTDSTFQEVANAIRKLEPPALIEQSRILVAGTKEVLMLATTQQADGPYLFDGRPYQRIGNTTSRMPQPEYQRRLLARALAKDRWENQLAEGYTLADLDMAEVERTLRAAVHQGKRWSMPFATGTTGLQAGR